MYCVFVCISAPVLRTYCVMQASEYQTCYTTKPTIHLLSIGAFPNNNNVVQCSIIVQYEMLGLV
jgi:hypothetical protein